MKQSFTQDSLPTRRIVSIFTGTMIQITGILLGSGLLWLGSQPMMTGFRITAMIAGYLLIYFTSHSLMHYAIGKLVGIQFKHYSIGGSYHTSSYPPLIRTIFSRLPFFAAHTQPVSMNAARPFAQALMFTAGITSTVLFCTVAALFAYRTHTPGGSVLLIFNLIWQVSSLISEIRPSGDLGKAFKAIKKQQHPRN